MNDINSMLLPIILESLNQKPELCDTYENLYKEIKYNLSTQGLKQRHGNIEKAIDSALSVGQNLGILTVTDDLVRVPFALHKGSKETSSLKKNVLLMNQSRNTHTVKPNLIPHGRPRRKISRGRAGHRRRRVSRRRSRSRRR